MYFSAVPVSVLFYLLWNPPLEYLGDTGLIWYLLFITIPLRLLVTFFEVPSNALVPDLTENYDERTRLFNYRWTVYFFAANGCSFILYAWWLRDTVDFPNGLLNAGGYEQMGLYGTVLIFLAIMTSSLGLHRHIPYLKKPPQKQKTSLKQVYRDIFTTFSDKSLIALLIAGMLYSSGNGVINALWAYIYTYFWGLNTFEISILLLAYVLASPIAFFVLRHISISREKRKVAISLCFFSAIISTLPVFLRILGLFPANESEWYFPLLFVHAICEMMMYSMFVVILASMMADLVEKREVVSGVRQEGLLFSTQTFIVKITSGMGVWIAGLTLGLINFPTNVGLEEVPVEIITRLGLVYAPIIIFLFGLASYCVSHYSLSREDHSVNMRIIQIKRTK